MSLGSIFSSLAEQQWLQALNQWYVGGGQAREAADPSFGLTPSSWTALQTHLVKTGWFTVQRGRIAPTGQGFQFLARVNELCRAIGRESQEDQIVIEILDGLPRGGAVEIGCGTGHFLCLLACLGYAPLFAYDLSPMALELARIHLAQHGHEACLYAKDATDLAEIESETLSLIFSRISLNYLRQAELARTLNRTLRPGGYVVTEVTGFRYYLRTKHLLSLLHRQRAWHVPSYARTVLRTLIYQTLLLQPTLGARAPEIGYTNVTIRRLARWAALDIISIAPAPASIGYLLVMRKPIRYAG